MTLQKLIYKQLITNLKVNCDRNVQKGKPPFHRLPLGAVNVELLSEAESKVWIERQTLEFEFGDGVVILNSSQQVLNSLLGNYTIELNIFFTSFRDD